MASIVLGLGTSHSPQLSTPPELWGLRVEADRANRRLAYRGRLYDFDGLLAARSPGFAAEASPDIWQRRHAACRTAIHALRQAFAEAAPDAAVVVGNDQRELFLEDITPSVTVFWGAEIPNVPLPDEARARLGPGLAVAEEGHCPAGGATYPGAPDLGRHILEQLVGHGFDLAASSRLPRDGNPTHGIPHAYGFVYRQLMADAPPPSVPVILNANVPPNPPTVRRCLALGRALHEAIRSWNGGRVALVASGGLTHFVIDEELDRAVLTALAGGDEETLASLSETHFQAGSGEIKNWIVVAAAMNAAGLTFRQVEYQPCYRSEAGTGTAMAFGTWS